MHKRKSSRNRKIILTHILFILFDIRLTQAGASSTPKNLFSLYTPNETLNSTSSTLFQNEYQYRQSVSKPTSSDRYKSSTPSGSESILDHLSSIAALTGDSNLGSNTGAPNYAYSDNSVMSTVYPYCQGRLKLNKTRGYITDGPGHYQTNLQCIWLIDSGRSNATIRIQLHQFNTECNYDFLYIFDGDSIYSPLVAALSGDMKDFSNTLVDYSLHEEDQSQPLESGEKSPTTKAIPGHGGGVLGSLSNQQTLAKNAEPTPTSIESRPFELKTNSGKAFIYFHSDTAQSMPGFFLTYSIDSCPMDCSNRGECNQIDLTCSCNSGFYGDGCQYILCPKNCTSLINGKCDEQKSCICQAGFTGADCSKKVEIQAWTKETEGPSKVPPLAFHKVAVFNNTMWLFGGRSRVLSNTNAGIFKHTRTPMIFSYDIDRRKWTDTIIDGVTGEDHLAELSGHSIAEHGQKAFIFGGLAMNNTVLDTLTVFDVKSKTLNTIPSNKNYSPEDFSAPLPVSGHSANIVDGIMYVFLGYNPVYGYINFAQKFNIANNSWAIIERRGSSISGCIGHTSNYDQLGKLIYIYGGHNALKSNKLYSFDPQSEIWTLLQAGPSPRYYHSSIVMNRQLIVFGGNSYNSSQQKDQCFQNTYITYDLDCTPRLPNNQKDSRNSSSSGFECGLQCWKIMEDKQSSILKRHGHSVVAYNDDELILFGGFNGILMNDLHYMKIEPCSSYTSEVECSSQKIARRCQWDIEQSLCLDNVAEATLVGSYRRNCTKADLKTLHSTCESRETCVDCLNTSLGCVWCGLTSQCVYKECKTSAGHGVSSPSQCSNEQSILDILLTLNSTAHPKNGLSNQENTNEMDCKVDSCYMCLSKPHCSWQGDSGSCTYSPLSQPPSLPTPVPQEASETPVRPSVLSENATRHMQKMDPFNRYFHASLSTSPLSSSPFHECDLPCYSRRSCNECTTTKCIWCSTTEQCIDSSAYFAYHAMGQCMHYVAHTLKCPVASCTDIETCDKCLTNPKCGWLNDISNTGKGKCVEETTDGPSLKNLTESNATLFSNTSLISSLPNWYYTQCPACQCNGHSYCKSSNSSLCVQPCQDNTEGPHCDRCIQGYFGYPVNGGSCKPCRCNGHAQTCYKETGKCYCSTKGIIGHNCNRCDEKNYYIGDPSSPNNGTCYYNLTTDYQYTFNMSKPEDHFYSEINFINVPARRDSDVDFSIACSRIAIVNITAGSSYKNRKLIHSGLECGSVRLRFPHVWHVMADSNYSFFVHVHKFQTPFILQVAFSQHRTLYLPQFFFGFSSCFLFVFALSGLLWKLKHEYDLYVRRQRQFIEMEQMASRPFSSILLETFRLSGEKDQRTAREQPTEPTPISFEPCFGSHVGVLSLFVQLPGRPNLAVGSALVSLNDEPSAGSGACDEEAEETSKQRRASKEGTSVKDL